MRERLKIHWVTREHTEVANAFGYNIHNKMMRKYCSELMDFDDNAPVAMTITPADHFHPVPGKVNILFTMWEFLDLPNSYIENINKADVIVVPSSFCRDLFRQYTDKPIYVCYEGVEPNTYRYYNRSWPRAGERFRFLWVGAPNPRKGYPLVLEMVKIFEKTKDVEIYLKTTAPKIDIWKSIKNAWKHKKEIFTDIKYRKSLLNILRSIPRPGLNDKLTYHGKNKNIIFDTRKLEFKDLVDLYNSAHCFLLPSFGEGWGLTLCEAMATGCPSIATPVTGIADFFNEEVGFPLSYEIREQELRNYSLKAKGYVPDTNDLLKQMLDVIANYKEALKRGRKASDRILNKFTWDQSAGRMQMILEEVYEKHGLKEAVA